MGSVSLILRGNPVPGTVPTVVFSAQQPGMPEFCWELLGEIFRRISLPIFMMAYHFPFEHAGDLFQKMLIFEGSTSYSHAVRSDDTINPLVDHMQFSEKHDLSSEPIGPDNSQGRHALKVEGIAMFLMPRHTPNLTLLKRGLLELQWSTCKERKLRKVLISVL